MAQETDRELVRAAVEETLRGLGFDLRAPEQLQADMYYLRRMRKGSEEMTRLTRRTLLTMAVSTALFLLWEAFKHVLQRSS